jgi:hypothetical protein
VWRNQQIRGLEAQLTGEPINDIDAGSVHTSFQSADISPVELGSMGEFLLG